MQHVVHFSSNRSSSSNEVSGCALLVAAVPPPAIAQPQGQHQQPIPGLGLMGMPDAPLHQAQLLTPWQQCRRAASSATWPQRAEHFWLTQQVLHVHSQWHEPGLCC